MSLHNAFSKPSSPKLESISNQVIQLEYETNEYIWFQTNLTTNDIVEASQYKRRIQVTATGKRRDKPNTKRIQVGKYINVNEKDVAIFKYKNQLYAIENTCPHQGGSLALGDIEDEDGTVCIACPRHRWLFSLENGQCQHSETLQAQCYPIESRQNIDGITSIHIGFPGIDASVFSNEDF